MFPIARPLTNSPSFKSFNSLSQSPCLIGSYLGGVCNAGQFSVGPLEVDKVYLGPTLATANPCRCSSVFYSLISACAACQGREYLGWSNYNANCSTVYPGIFVGAIPSGTKVPHYAYLDPTTADTFNITAAMDALGEKAAPESTAIPKSTGATLQSSSGSSKSKAGPIAGGVVGGIVALALIAAFVFWWTRRRRARTAPSSEVNTFAPATASVAPTPMSYNTAAPPFNGMPSPRLYDPSDPSTYPSTGPSTGAFTNSSQALYPNTTGNSYPGPGPAQGGRYTGAPEL
ncbi:hypothetical protein FPV67DRAFT_1557261 [Lyophyllum atratum]|nr:hypothetical protein FPV67DRAFT_1557261 [Lyophyllum atratum]